MQSRMTKFATVVVTIIAVGIVIISSGQTSYAIAQTTEALRGVQSLRMTIINNSQTSEMLMRINQQTGIADYIRMDTRDSGDVIITIPGQSYIYSKQKNEVSLLGQELLTNDLNFKDVINSLIEQTNASEGHLKITNSFNEVAQQKVHIVTIFRQDESVAGELLIDPDSNLPLYIGTESQGGQLNYLGPIEYNVDVPENAFEFFIPKSAKVTDNRPEELKVERPEEEQPFHFDITETAVALQKANNVHGIFIDRKGRRVNSWAQINPDTGKLSKMRLEYEDGGLYIIANGKTYIEDDSLVAIKDGHLFKSGFVFNNFIAVIAQRVREQDEVTIQKQFSEEFQREVIVVDILEAQYHVQAIVDIDTKRPIKFSIPWTSDLSELLDYTELVEYDVDLPEGTFDFETGPDTLILGKDLARKLLNDSGFGVAYEDEEELQQVCEKIAKEFLQAEIEKDIETIKQLHPYYLGHYGSSKAMERHFDKVENYNGRIVEILSFGQAYEDKSPKTMLIPCKVAKEYRGQRKELFVGVYVYLRNHDGHKSAVINGYMFPLPKDMIK